MGFKYRDDKPYTKADHYRELEERAAAKRAAAFSVPVIVTEIKEPAWLEEEQIQQEVVVPEQSVFDDVTVKVSEDTIQDLKAFADIDLEVVVDLKPVEVEQPVVAQPTVQESKKEIVEKTKKQDNKSQTKKNTSSKNRRK
jgi:hypothetical protein